ncbi:SDR family oxidoreductase [Kineosporia succinea]|uniref:Short-subunit dehydrogenase involved in D-alanine esterification of teichoic acids n=1 Tax=Kineosporia succinea TaxID=84632 RepID=A0ABT9PDR6_9ACTN|nr:SDR family NAD(P)-dependent oxidoreductase [Kineosporia succinea]MDP9830853.1 short-subunit dehydrogenase involved in D-alanine esterification of teichoic acids [Kineosporia succinea]
MNITGNTIFVPGATSGIGLALAVRLRAAGNTVIIGGRRAQLLAELKQQHGFGTVVIDTTDPASVLRARDEVLEQYPDLDVLIAMAGIMKAENVLGPDFLADATSIVDTNVNGPLRLIAAFVDHLRTRPRAALVTVSSGLAHVPLALTPTYNGSKAFVHLFTESIRLQLAGTPVQVIEIVPPAVRTELLPGGSDVEHFMPLDEFADEVMALLESEPDAHEILVRTVSFLRRAEVEGRYPAAVEALNAH